MIGPDFKKKLDDVISEKGISSVKKSFVVEYNRLIKIREAMVKQGRPIGNLDSLISKCSQTLEYIYDTEQEIR